MHVMIVLIILSQKTSELYPYNNSGNYQYRGIDLFTSLTSNTIIRKGREE